MQHGTVSRGLRLPRTYVPRRRLWDQLDRTTQGAVTVVVAPAGAGKTLGACGWLPRADIRSSALWVDADASWDVARLESALESSAHDAADAPRLIVIDDAHQLPAASLRLLDDRLSNAPETLRLLLLSRWDLPFTRLVPELLGHYSSLRGDVLRMDDEETAALVRAHVPGASPEVVEAISAYAQGWCAPAVLTARVVAAAHDPVAAARRFATSDARGADQVVSEVFAALRADERHLLLCVGGDKTVTASAAARLCADARAGETLARLETTGLLVTRTRDSWSEAGLEAEVEPQYRIHPLLTEVVRRQLMSGGADVSRARATVSRAVRLDLAHGEGAHAFERLVAVNEVQQAAGLLATAGVTMVMRGEGPAVAAFARRHVDVIEDSPGTWFAVALERWDADDVEAARAWMGRALSAHVDGRIEGAEDPDSTVVACIRLMRARLGLEPLQAAVEQAQRVVVEGHAGDHEVLPQLLTELGAAQNWSGDLAHAEANLTTSVELCRHRGLLALAATAASHLACTQIMAGRERAAVDVATEALSLLGAALPFHPRFASTRATLALFLGGLVDLPWPSDLIEALATPTPVPAADSCTRFWLRMRDARLALLAGSTADAERILTTPLAGPTSEELLPDHLHVVALVEHAFLAVLASDRDALRGLEPRLVALGAGAEAALVRGLLADLSGDRRAATAAFGIAAESSPYAQPPSRALALVCQAQLLDADGHPDAAIDRLREAVQATEVRRNAVPFLGWCHQGTPVESLLTRLAELDGSAASRWLHELAAATAGHADITSCFASTTATPRERSAAAGVVGQPSLSPREREVLRELARGATYADIATTLFVSGNTVKTHVSSLYSKLAVSRRSEALAVARSLHLL